MIDAADRAAELNALLAAIAFATEPPQIATARGALLATALDVALAKGPDKQASLQRFIRGRLADAAVQNRDTIVRADFVAKVREAAGDAFATVMTATLDRGAEVPLPVDLAGPCYRLVSAELVPFELGFVTTSGAELVVTTVTPKSRAAAAGVMIGDVVTDLHYERGKARAPVTAVLVRGARKIPIRFVPAGASRRGRMFERLPGIPVDRC